MYIWYGQVEQMPYWRSSTGVLLQGRLLGSLNLIGKSTSSKCGRGAKTMERRSC
jgi:hypothetical protein